MKPPSSKSDASLRVRRLGPGDADAVAELSGQLGYPVDPQIARERLEGILCSAEQVAFAALLQEEVVGWIEAYVERHLQAPATVVIGGLVVRDNERGRGIGATLCGEVEQWARSIEITKIRVRSRTARQEAHRFYQKQGFEIVKTSVVFEKTLDLRD